MAVNQPTNHIWTASSEFGTYSLCEQRRFRRACASAQSRQNLHCSLIQAESQEEPPDRNPDPWSLWMAGHAQLKFVMTECSKTQIHLTGPILLLVCSSVTKEWKQLNRKIIIVEFYNFRKILSCFWCKIIIFLLYCIGKKRAHILSELCDRGWLFTTDVSATQGIYITSCRPECYGRIPNIVRLMRKNYKEFSLSVWFWLFFYVSLRMVTSICIAHLSAQLYVSSNTSFFKQHKMNQLVRKNNTNNKKRISSMFELNINKNVVFFFSRGSCFR